MAVLPVPAGRRSEARAAGRPTAVPCPVRIQPALSSGRVVNAAWTGDSVQLREVAAPSGGTVSSPASPGSRLSGRGPGRPGRQPCRDGPIRSGLRGPVSSHSRRPSWRNRADAPGGAGRGPSCFPVIVTASAWLRTAASMRACMCRPLPIALPRGYRLPAAPGTGMRWHAERHPFTPPVTRQCARAAPAGGGGHAARIPRAPGGPRGGGRTAIPTGERKGASHERYRRKEGLGVPAAQPRLQGGGGGCAARGDGAGAVPDAGADRGRPGGVEVGPSGVGGPAGG